MGNIFLSFFPHLKTHFLNKRLELSVSFGQDIKLAFTDNVVMIILLNGLFKSLLAMIFF